MPSRAVAIPCLLVLAALLGGPAARAADNAAAPAAARDEAWRLLADERARDAVAAFRAWLASEAGRDDRDARRGLALALSWSGDQDAAVALYAELVAQDPADGEARLGLARSRIWDNRLRRGWRDLRALERADPGAPDAGAFALTVLDGYDTPWEARVDFSHDSDRLDILRAGARATWDIAPSLLLQALPSRARYTQDGLPPLTAWRFGAGLVAPLAPAWHLHAYGWVDRFRSADPVPGATDAGPLRWDPAGGDAWLAWHATDRLRLDLGANRQPVETLPALARETALAQGSLSADWRLTRRVGLAASAARGRYSDGNRRWLAAARLQWRREGRVELAAGPALTWLDCAQPGAGYWSPDWMRNASLEAAAATRGPRWTLRAAARVGRESEPGAGTITVVAWSARAGWRCAPGALVALEGGHARSRLASAGGYARDFLALSIRGFF